MRAYTIFYDRFCGEMKKITISEKFKEEHPLLRADVLKDICAKFEEEYDSALEDQRALWKAAGEEEGKT